MNITNNFTMVHCDRCHTDGLYITQDDQGRELAICHHCGAVEARRNFNALDYIVGLIHDDITKEDDIAEILADKLGDEYYWLEFMDVELIAKLLVKEFYDEAMFQAKSEDTEVADYCQEISNDYRQMALGVA